MRKYCRICWNTSYWREPTGDASRIETGKSYVREHGFGHEEWLFNFSWLQPGPAGTSTNLKYGFLQPIGVYRDSYEGKTFDILAYTVTPEREKVAVATIKNLYVPPISELTTAFRLMKKNGWVKEMESDLSKLGISSSHLGKHVANNINVRFDPLDVTFFDPRIVVPHSHKLHRSSRYLARDWDDAFPMRDPTVQHKQPFGTNGKRRSEDERKRAAVAGTKYSPQHVRLQNVLYDYLCERHGEKAIAYEKNYVDLALNDSEGVTYFEIKIAPTAKSCIREALGQLLEYAMYPGERRARKLVIVGDGRPTESDIGYLQYLRHSFGLPIYYRCWDWISKSLDAES
jgi:hypothetical protein